MIYLLNQQTENYVRNSYVGGRCDIYKYGTYKNAYYYDFTSLYPAVCKNALPVGKPKFVEGSEITQE